MIERENQEVKERVFIAALMYSKHFSSERSSMCSHSEGTFIPLAEDEFRKL